MDRKFLIIITVGIITIALGSAILLFGFFQGDERSNECKSATSEQVMIMRDEVYEPEDLSIERCTRVIFRNEADTPRWPASNIHPTHGIYPEFDPKEPVEAGGEWSFVFDKAGRWKYHDHLAPLIRGVIEVSE